MTRSIFQRSKAGLNSEFFLNKAKEPGLPYYLSIARGRIVGFIPFPRVFACYEMQTVSSRFELGSPCPSTITVISRSPPRVCMFVIQPLTHLYIQLFISYIYCMEGYFIGYIGCKFLSSPSLFTNSWIWEKVQHSLSNPTKELCKENMNKRYLLSFTRQNNVVIRDYVTVFQLEGLSALKFIIRLSLNLSID